MNARGGDRRGAAVRRRVLLPCVCVQLSGRSSRSHKNPFHVHVERVEGGPSGLEASVSTNRAPASNSRDPRRD